MRKYVLFAAIFAACATGQLLGMQTQVSKQEASKGCLSFYVDRENKIKAYSALSMDFTKKSDELKGANLLDKLPLDPRERDLLYHSLISATMVGIKTTMSYPLSLDGKKFEVTLRPMYRKKKVNVFVEFNEQ